MVDKILKFIWLAVSVAGLTLGMATILATIVAPMLTLENRVAFMLASIFLIITCLCVAFTILEKGDKK